MRFSRPALLLAVLTLAVPAALNGVGEEGELLQAGQVRESAIKGGEKHVYHVEVTTPPFLVTVAQLGLDLVVEASGPGAKVSADAGNHGWGTEVLLLESAGEYRIEVRPKERFVGRASYKIEVEELQAAPDDRRAALSLMSRAGREAFQRTQESRGWAVTLYREAQAAWHALGERRWEAEALYAIAVLERDREEFPAAAEDFLRGLAIWRELNETPLEASTLNGLGITRTDMRQLGPSREALQSALTLWQRLEERFEEVETRSNLCALDQASNDLKAARTCFEEILPLFHDLGFGKEEANVLNSLGGVYDGLGEPDAALESYGKALALRQEGGEHLEEARTLNNLGTVHRALGEWQEALRLYDQAREILAPLGNRKVEAARLNNVGFTYNSLGDPQRARTFLEACLKLRRETGDRVGEIIALNNLGSSWRNFGDPKQAIELHQRALALALAPPEPRQEAISRLRLAEAQADLGDATGALSDLDQPLDHFHKTASRRYEVLAMDLRGHALNLAKRPQDAMTALNAALDLHRTLHDRAGEADALHELAISERSLGRLGEAHAHAQEAVAQVEALRAGFVSPGLRATFLATQRRAYSLLIDLLMAEGHDREALEISERARARSLLDVLQAGNTVHTTSAIPAALLDKRSSLRRRLSAKADQQLKQTGAAAEALRKESETLLPELDGVEAEIRRLDPRYAAVFEPRTLSVEDVARLLDPHTLLLEYCLGEDRSYLWAIEAGHVRSFVLPPQKKIEMLARQLHEELTTIEAGAGRRKSAKAELSHILLGRVASAVTRSQRLVVVPDGALHLVPFAALPNPGSGRLLLEQVEIAYLPSVTTLDVQRQRLERRAPALHWAAVIADPVFKPNDPRLAASPSVATRSAPSRRASQPSRAERGVPDGAPPLSALERLPATRTEAQTIATLAPSGQVWTALDLAANREAVLSGGLRDYRVIHFATHGLADARRPDLSGLVLSLVDAAGKPQEGFLSLADIYDLDLNADLVVLSGCRTSFGQEVPGEGVMSLTRGFLYAGVPRVVASLWRVQDGPTAKLMTLFYRALWQDHLPPAAALRKAQRSLRSNFQYREPYYWAGFVLQGDWR
ncbi:MAG TPA: CHAT domain-containing protein [Thermoanaerobaculia bacterium]|nr:CHAT domain-containing protein [Thermoanaerobaculia bacterium]